MIKKTLPEIIYHYTTPDGLMGILKEQALWATKIHYMNDASELGEPLRIASSSVTVYIEELDASDVKDIDLKRDIARGILDDIRRVSHTNICLVSFCTNGDLLSQWRGYGNLDSAYSIGFDSKNLIESIRSHPFGLHPCQYYNPDAYRQKIDQYILEFIKEGSKENTIPNDFIGKFLKMASAMKFHCFQEEDEWRLVSSKTLNYHDVRFNFRPSKSMLIPYYSLSIDLSSIAEIIIGPCQHPDLALHALAGLSFKFNIRPNIKISQIPYRVF